MKSERRHDLEENELAKDLGKSVEFLKKHLNKILAGAIIVVLAVWLVYYAVSSRRINRQNEWVSFYQSLRATSLEELHAAPQQLLELSEDTGQEDLAAWAALAAGNMAYQGAMIDPNAAPEARREMFDQSRRAYQRVVDEFGDHVHQVGHAHVGLGLVAEAEGDMTAARSQYEQAMAMASVGANAAVSRARIRLAELDDLQPARLAPGLPPEAQAATLPAGPVVTPDQETEPATMSETQPETPVVQ